MSLNEPSPFLPVDELPQTCFAGLNEVEWLDLDWEGGYRARGHPVFGEHDIRYRFNARGYRCVEFDATAEIRVVSIGCSYVMGVGLPQGALFHERFAERLGSERGRTVVNWNLGLPGASNDYICRTLFLALPVLKPHLVLVNFTHGGRREYVSVQGRLASYNPGVRPPDRVGREIGRHFDALCSPGDDALNLFRNYKALEGLLSRHLWLFSATQSDAFDALDLHIDRSRYAGHLTRLDFARDHAHPGPLSHAMLLECYWNRFLASGRARDL